MVAVAFVETAPFAESEHLISGSNVSVAGTGPGSGTTIAFLRG